MTWLVLVLREWAQLSASSSYSVKCRVNTQILLLPDTDLNMETLPQGLKPSSGPSQNDEQAQKAAQEEEMLKDLVTKVLDSDARARCMSSGLNLRLSH